MFFVTVYQPIYIKKERGLWETHFNKFPQLREGCKHPKGLRGKVQRVWESGPCIVTDRWTFKKMCKHKVKTKLKYGLKGWNFSPFMWQISYFHSHLDRQDSQVSKSLICPTRPKSQVTIYIHITCNVVWWSINQRMSFISNNFWKYQGIICHFWSASQFCFFMPNMHNYVYQGCGRCLYILSESSEAGFPVNLLNGSNVKQSIYKCSKIFHHLVVLGVQLIQ